MANDWYSQLWSHSRHHINRNEDIDLQTTTEKNINVNFEVQEDDGYIAEILYVLIALTVGSIVLKVYSEVRKYIERNAVIVAANRA